MGENLTNTEVETEVTETDVVGLDGYEETSSEKTEEVADPQVTEDSSVEDTQTKEVDVNAIAAAARREAEARARNVQASIDAEYVRRFGHLTNPKTGAPIRSQADYLAALDAQEELRTEAELKEKGIDPNIINNAIANNPMIRHAQEVIAQNEKIQALSQINNDVIELSKLDPSITSFENVPPNVIQMSMQSNGNINLVDAYKILNYGKVSSSQQAAITQNAINQAKGKNHLTPVNGVSTPDEGVEIPSAELNMWKEMFPDKSASEIKALYNKTL